MKKLHVLNIYTTHIASVAIRHFAYKRNWSVIQPDYVPIQSLFASRLYRECFESYREFTFAWKSATMQQFCRFNEHFLRSIIARLMMSVALIFRIDWVSLAIDLRSRIQLNLHVTGLIVCSPIFWSVFCQSIVMIKTDKATHIECRMHMDTESVDLMSVRVLRYATPWFEMKTFWY